MANRFGVQTRLTLSKSFEPRVSGFTFGKYQVEALPSVQGSAEGILEFANTFEAPVGGGSHPEEEANIVCNFLSLVLEARVSRSGLRMNDIDVSAGERDGTYGRYVGRLASADPQRHLKQFQSMPLDLARQVCRSCRAFASAVHFIPSDATFAFFLLVVAVECLSSQAAIIPSSELDLDSKKCERFCRFIERFLLDSARGEDERNTDLFRELLKTVYYSHRSGFVHGGREVSAAALMADSANSSYFKHATEGTEVKTPGLGWFAGIVRGSILGYLSTIEATESSVQPDLVAQLAFEKAALKLKVNKAMDAGRVVTLGDIEYR